MLEIFGLVFKPLVGLFKDHMKEKSRKQEMKERIEEAKTLHKINRIEAGDEHAMKLDVIERQNAGWMDDFSFAVFMIPAILAFFPAAVPHVVNGFAALEKMPIWYQYALAGMLIAVWGYRRIITPIIEKVLANKFK